MDAWSPLQLDMMRAGGNAKMVEAFREAGIPDDAPIAEKYATAAAALYRKRVKLMAETGQGLDTPAEEADESADETPAPADTKKDFFADF
jgi:hypothetical protein